MKLTDKINIHHIDCMEFMKSVPDNYYDLCITDPPYGINVANDCRFGKKSSNKAATITKNYIKKNWDLNVPDKIFWDELFRISKNQIIWGVNYYTDKRFCGGRIFWDKQVPEDYTKSKGEIAYKSIGAGVDYVKVIWHGMLQQNMKNKEQRIHCTQKPIALYEWLLKKYAKPNDKIIDTHAGSLSIAIAVDKANVYDKKNLTLDACEIDTDYYNDSIKRFKKYKQQFTMEL